MPADVLNDAGPEETGAPADPRETIVRLEEQIEALARSAERCAQIARLAKAMLVLGCLGLAMVAAGLIKPTALAIIWATAAALGGLVLYGANASTAKQVAAAQARAETLRRDLIGSIELRVIDDSA